MWQYLAGREKETLSWVQSLQTIGGRDFQQREHGEGVLGFYPGQRRSGLRSATFIYADFNEMSCRLNCLLQVDDAQG